MPNAVVLLSGGLDSTTTLAIAKSQLFDVTALTFRYGQRHEHEVVSAREIARESGVTDHVIVDLDLRVFGRSSLTDDIDVPVRRSTEEMSSGIPSTYVPARNSIFLSYAMALAEVRNAFDIFLGVNALDYAGYPDCRPDYVAAFENMASLATKTSVQSGHRLRIHAPLIEKSKAEIVQIGRDLGVDFGLTSSCYQPTLDGKACGECDACILRLQGFAANGLADEVEYARS